MNDVIQQIKDRLSIVDVVSAYVELHRAGRHFKGKSPFSQEKTPSFYVSPDRGMYYCFSTSQGGDMFNFVQVMEGVDFKGGSKNFGGQGWRGINTSITTKRQREIVSMLFWRKQLIFFEHSLVAGSAPREYIEKRGVTLTTSMTWRLGYAPGSDNIWRTTKDHLIKKGFTENELLKAGLIKTSQKGRESYDVFRNRVMFPIFDQGGRVVAFSGRTLESGADIPKYVNSPETDLFKKSEILYGYHRAKHGIRQLDFSLIVEGQFDVVMSHQAGYTNTVAVSGTALTLHHVQLLERLSKKVVLALDADKAGIAAMKRAADLMLRRGLDVKVAVLVGGKDPADIILDDPKKYKKIIGNSIHVIEFLLANLASIGLDERTFKLRAREEVLPYILLLPNKIDQDHFEGRVAEVLKTTKEAVHFEVERLNDLAEQGEKVSMAKEIVENKIENNSANNRFETLLNYLFGILPLFTDEVSAKILQAIEDIVGEEREKIKERVSSQTSSEVTFRTELALEQYPRRVFEDEVIHSLNQLREVVIKDRLKLSREKIMEVESSGDSAEVEAHLKYVAKLQELRKTPPFTTALLH
ncbi:MAG: DNA primase [Parcubacteria bacterium OLB19]|nr:MAG: DNA primase [Parcubacteria bacterium OLB19]